MKVLDRANLAKNLVRIQEKWMSISFEKYGSLYFQQDVDPALRKGTLYTDEQGQKHDSDEFAIGPSVSRRSSNDGRAHVEFDRGPCSVFTSLPRPHSTDSFQGQVSTTTTSP